MIEITQEVNTNGGGGCGCGCEISEVLEAVKGLKASVDLLLGKGKN